MGSSVGAHIQLCTCSPCLASMLLRQLSAFRLATVHLTSSPNVVLESSSTRSLMQSQAKRACCLSQALFVAASPRVHSVSYFLLHLQECFWVLCLCSFLQRLSRCMDLLLFSCYALKRGYRGIEL